MTTQLSIAERSEDWLRRYVGSDVVIDLTEFYLLIGSLVEVGPDHLTLVDADLHDHREGNSTKDIYLIETRKFGIRINRRRVDIPRRHLIAISKLDDVATP
jgi:hypothetical protein